MLVEETPRPRHAHFDQTTRPNSPHHLVPNAEPDLETVSSLHLPKPFILSKRAPSALQPGQRISNAITSLSDPDGSTTFHDAMHHLTSYGSTTVRARSIKGLSPSVQHIPPDEDRPVVLSLPRSVSSGKTYDTAPNSLSSRLKPLTAIRIDALPRSIPILTPDQNEDAGAEAVEHWDKTPKRAFDATPTARPHLVARIPSTLSIAVPSLQSVSLSTVKPDTLAHHRQFEEYNAVLAALTESHNGPTRVNGQADANGDIGHGRLCVEIPPVKVDELAVEWCFFCSRERNRAELELVDLGQTGGGGAGEQWVCRGHCEERKSEHGLGFEGVEGWGPIRADDGSAVGRMDLVQGMSEGGRDTEI